MDEKPDAADNEEHQLCQIVDEISDLYLEYPEVDPVETLGTVRSEENGQAEDERNRDRGDRDVRAELPEIWSNENGDYHRSKGRKENDPGAEVHSSEFQRVNVFDVRGLPGTVQRDDDCESNGDFRSRDRYHEEHQYVRVIVRQPVLDVE